MCLLPSFTTASILSLLLLHFRLLFCCLVLLDIEPQSIGGLLQFFTLLNDGLIWMFNIKLFFRLLSQANTLH